VVLLNTFLASDLYFFRLLSQPVSKSSIGGGFRWREASTLVDNHRGYETVVKCDGTTLFGVDAKTRKLIWFWCLNCTQRKTHFEGWDLSDPRDPYTAEHGNESGKRWFKATRTFGL